MLVLPSIHLKQHPENVKVKALDQLHVRRLEWSPTDGEEYLNLVSPLLTSKVTVSVLGIDILAQSCKLLPFIAT